MIAFKFNSVVRTMFRFVCSPANANPYTFGGGSLSVDPYPGGGKAGGGFTLKGRAEPSLS